MLGGRKGREPGERILEGESIECWNGTQRPISVRNLRSPLLEVL